MSQLTVEIAPNVAVTPVIPVPAAGEELYLPFQINPATGGVAVTNLDLLILEQHIATIINTVALERLMFPTYGTPTQHQVFQSNRNGNWGFLVKDIQNAVLIWEPKVSLKTVTINPDAVRPNTLDILVQFSVIPSLNLNTMTVTVGGSIQEVIGS